MLRVIVNVGGGFVRLPSDARCWSSSAELDTDEGVPTDTAVWVKVS